MITVISCYHDIADGDRPDFSVAAGGLGKLMIGVPTRLVPVHPGETLLEEFLGPRNLTQRQLADAIRVPYQRVNEIVNGRRGITPSTALRLAKVFGVSASFWLTLQLRWELYRAQQAEASALAEIERLPDVESDGETD